MRVVFTWCDGSLSQAPPAFLVFYEDIGMMCG